MIESWTGCYDAGWKGLITDESFAHPAKFSRNLIGRIYRHILERRWLTPGMTVVDPFGGVALGALDAMANGLHWTGCELEPKFHALGNQNIAEWVRRYGHSAGWGTARLLNGDSRRLREVVGGADCVVGSPPFLENNVNIGAVGDTPAMRQQIHNSTKRADSYGTTDGQLGSMKAGSVDAVLSSPPYTRDALGHKGGEGPRTTNAAHSKPGTPNSQVYGDEPGNLGNLRPGSVADAIVGSPPFQGSLNDGADHQRMHERYPAWGKNADGSNRMAKSVGQNYGSTPGNIGAEHGETFWHAAHEIVQQCHAILKPGGIAAWVTKDFVRNKARVPFSADWLKLCEACGFELVEWVHASLVKDLGKHADLYGDVHHKTVERKSFFRRLAEKKGSPRIDHEDVIFVRKAEVEQQGELFTA